MKKLLVALGFALASAGAQADIVGANAYGSVLTGEGTQATNKPFDPTPGPGLYLAAGTNFLTGTLTAWRDGTFYATFLGSESGFRNFYMDNATTIVETGANVGTTASMYVAAAGAIDFGFGTQAPLGHASFHNGDVNTADLGIGFLKNVWGFKDGAGNLFDFIVGFNDDFARHRDFDDMVMGVRFVPTPVPAALPLLATGLALFGFSRRKGV
jgi:hypothetical protein